MIEHRSLEIVGDEWLAEMAGEEPDRRFQIKVDGRSLGPLVTWPDHRAVLATGDVVHQEELRDGVDARWRVKGDVVTVGIYYEGRGRIAIRAALAGIGEWKTTGGFPIARRSRRSP
jgi:hypothetical protein